MASLVDKSNNCLIFRGLQPAADYLAKKTRDHVLGPFSESYRGFMQSRMASDVVEAVRDDASSYGVADGNLDGDGVLSFVSDRDMELSGAVGNSFALVRRGSPDAPIRMIISHTDAPCLKVSGQPAYMQTDADKSYLWGGIYVNVRSCGGIRPSDWYGQPVDVIGRVCLGGRERKIALEGKIDQKSLHVEDPDEIKGKDMLRVDVGARDREELYRMFGVRDSMDFARAEIQIYPHFYGGQNGTLVGNEIMGFGHDDRACVWASKEAFFESMNGNSPSTLMVFGLDREEVGSTSSSGGFNGFFSKVVQQTLRRTWGDKYSELDLPMDLSGRLMRDLPTLIADVDVALGDQELDDPEINYWDGAKIGWGPFIYTHDSEWKNPRVSPVHVDGLMSLFDNFPGRTPRNRYQVVGDCTTPDAEAGIGLMADVFDGLLPTLTMGVPIKGLHTPRGESLNIFDLFWLKEGYGLYLRALE